MVNCDVICGADEKMVWFKCGVPSPANVLIKVNYFPE